MLSNNNSKVVYLGNGVATSFPFNFKVWDESELLVECTAPDGSSFTAVGFTAKLTESGGTIDYSLEGEPLPEGYRLVILRDMPFKQEVDLIASTRFDPEVIETALDKATAERQELREKVSRAILTDPWNDNPQELIDQIFEAARVAKESALDPLIAAGSTEPRTISDRFGDVVNVKDYGAKGDGITDDTEGVQAALKRGRRVYFPHGDYFVSGNLLDFHKVEKVGEGRIFKIDKGVEYYFHITPSAQDINTLYCSAIPMENGDGLTPSTGMELDIAIDAFKNWPKNNTDGKLIIQLGEGDFISNGMGDSILPTFRNSITLKGTCQIKRVEQGISYKAELMYFKDAQCVGDIYIYKDESTWNSDIAEGVYFNEWLSKVTPAQDRIHNYFWRSNWDGMYGNMKFEEISFADWQPVSGSSWGGVAAQDSANIVLYRCQFVRCFYGAWIRGGYIRADYCSFVSNSTGLMCQYSEAGGVVKSHFYDCEIGLHSGRNSTIHSDYNLFDTCANSLKIMHNSRVAIVGGHYTNWTAQNFYVYTNSLVTGEESATYGFPTSREMPLAYSHINGITTGLDRGPAKFLHSYAYPQKATIIHTGTTERTSLYHADYARVGNIPGFYTFVNAEYVSTLMLKLTVECICNGEGIYKLDLNTEHYYVNPILQATINCTHFDYYTVEFQLRIRKEQPLNTSLLHVSGRTVVNGVSGRLTMLPSAAPTAAFPVNTDRNLLRLYATLGDPGQTFTLLGYHSELYSI